MALKFLGRLSSFARKLGGRGLNRAKQLKSKGRGLFRSRRSTALVAKGPVINKGPIGPDANVFKDFISRAKKGQKVTAGGKVFTPKKLSRRAKVAIGVGGAGAAGGGAFLSRRRRSRKKSRSRR